MFALARARPSSSSSSLPRRTTRAAGANSPAATITAGAARTGAAAPARAFSSSGVRRALFESDEDRAVRASVAAFARDVVLPHVAAMDEAEKMKPEVIKACFENGLMGTEIATDFGGAGMTFTQSCIVIEELAKVDPAVSVMVDVQNTLVSTIINKWATKEQKETFLPRLCKDTLGSFCLSEWGSGSDAFALRTKCVEVKDKFILNGSKAWITNSAEAGFFIVMATSDPALGYKGITAFAIDAGTPGLSVGKKEKKMGIRASSTCEVLLTDCVVPASSIIGTQGKGYKVAIEGLNEGRIGIASQMLGLAQGVFDITMKYILGRKQFGVPIASFQGMQFQFARMAADIEAARLLTYNAARMKDAGLDCRREAAIAKLTASETAGRVASLCVEMCGGMGFVRELGVEKFFRDSKIGVIYEGTSNMLLQGIAKSVAADYE